MKSLIVLALVVASSQSFALNCSSGEMGYDTYRNIQISNGNVEIQMHESFLSADAASTQVSGNSVAILDKTLFGNAEGDEFSAKTNALFVYDSVTNKLNTTLILDGHSVISAELFDCK